MENEAWGYKLIDALIGQGVEYFCIAPGSRSTPLALAIVEHPKARYTVHFDERGLCFFALGLAKGSKTPVAIVATSGTAVANLFPAVMEACNDHVPLLLLTADRPPELRDCGANQTCDQVRIFSNFVRWQIDLPCPDSRIPERYLASTISHAVAMASLPPAGPVHINCMFREPLIGIPCHEGIALSPCVHAPVLHPDENAIAYWQQALSKPLRGVVLAGSSSPDAVFALAERLGWPVFADILSSLRTKDHPSLIPHFDPLLKLQGGQKIDAVIQFGERFVSKTLAQWLEKQSLEFYLQVIDHPMRHDPSHLATHRALCSPALFTQKLLSSLPPQEGWLARWQAANAQCEESLREQFNTFAELTEPGAVWEIASFLTEEWDLFLGSSMPIRDADQFFSSRCGAIFGNRGVSGIDGNIATFCGIAEGRKRPLVALIGDQTFLHDLNSLALLAKSKLPIVLCVINNGGGGIFSFLPVSKRSEAYEEFAAAAHKRTFASAAALFGLPYFTPRTPTEFRDLLFRQRQSPGTCVIEIGTDRKENVRVHENICISLSAGTLAALP